MLSGEEPRRQKTRGPERGGIIREVSTKKIGKERNAQGQEASEYRADPDRESVRFEASNDRRTGLCENRNDE